MPDLIHIVYVSTSKHDFSEKELSDLLQEIRVKNKSLGVTGLLLYNEGLFIQVVEGERQILQDLFQNIKKDLRHSNLVELLEEPITSRSFPNWSMGFKIVGNKELERIPGFSGLMNDNYHSVPLPGIAEQVLILLNSFRRYT